MDYGNEYFHYTGIFSDDETIQNLADQRRAIMKKNYIPSAILEKIKNDVKLELSINYSENRPQMSHDLY
jgi:hypothetical protein